VITSEAAGTFSKAFWQHTGLIVSSRQAEAVLAGRRIGLDEAAVRNSLRRPLADCYDFSSEIGVLFSDEIRSMDLAKSV
jgi:3-hydroxyisobutyrate dehydrogenase-like beta-hydroxyacid dehydrogenase